MSRALGSPLTRESDLGVGGVLRGGLEDFFQEFPRFRFPVAGNLQADPLSEKSIDVLDKRCDLAQNEERNSGVLKQALRHRKLDAIVSLQHNNQFETRIERVLRIRLPRSGQEGNMAVRAFGETIAILNVALRTVHKPPLDQVYRRFMTTCFRYVIWSENALLADWWARALRWGWERYAFGKMTVGAE